MAREVPHYRLSHLLGRTEVSIHDPVGIEHPRMVEMFNWLTDTAHPGVFSCHMGTALTERARTVRFLIEDERVAFAFKMRFG
jgi:hypothetical protein